jgi:hypothetical protein
MWVSKGSKPVDVARYDTEDEAKRYSSIWKVAEVRPLPDGGFGIWVPWPGEEDG